MLCLSIKQPYAHLIVHGVKDIENRDWRFPPIYRGPLLIHAGQKPNRDVPWAWIRERCGQPLPPNYPLGGIVGRVELVDVVRQSASSWFVGPLGFVFEKAQPLPFTPLKGHLGLFDVDMRVFAQEPETCAPSYKLYTLGYAGRTLDDLVALVDTHQATLMDIRYSPRSRLPGFNKASLAQHLGQRYVHCPALGNRNYQGGPIALADYPAGLAHVRTLLTTTPVLILLCVCRNVQACHRTNVAEALSDDLGIPHYHID